MSEPTTLTPSASVRGAFSLSVSERVLAGLYLPAALALALLVPGGHPLLIWPTLAAVAAYLAQRKIRMPLGTGDASVLQPAFVILLFAVPLNWVATLVPLALLASTAVGGSAGSRRRLASVVADAWYCVAPVIVLALWAPGQFDWNHWLAYLVALAAELAVFLVGTFWRLRIEGGLEPKLLTMPAAINLLLSPLGAAAAHAAALAPEQSVLILGSVLTLVALLGRERAERLGFEHRALRDGLTGLANRALFDELLDAAARRQTRSGEDGGLLFIDLDNFKEVNDTHGHLAGDVVLRTTAERIQSVVRDADTVARFGGDEFAVLLADAPSPAAVQRVASAISRAVADPIEVQPGQAVNVGASIGVARLSAGTEPAEAVASADEAMYEAKAVAHARGA